MAGARFFEISPRSHIMILGSPCPDYHVTLRQPSSAVDADGGELVCIGQSGLPAVMSMGCPDISMTCDIRVLVESPHGFIRKEQVEYDEASECLFVRSCLYFSSSCQVQ